MLFASVSCRPSAFDFDIRSEPARSRKDSVVVVIEGDDDSVDAEDDLFDNGKIGSSI